MLAQNAETNHLTQLHRLDNTNYFYNYALLTSANLTIGIVAAIFIIRKITR